MSIMPVLTSKTEQLNVSKYPYSLTIRLRFTNLNIMGRWLKHFGRCMSEVFKGRHFKIIMVTGDLNDQSGDVIFKR